ncbi:hypothetical protein, partial [Brucella anthropi]|uniref:hypothetical protein n=1 Tax=Brucella anthropi TaxID=529 RepID=UPI001AEBB32A
KRRASPAAFSFGKPSDTKALFCFSLNEGCIRLGQNWYSEAFPAKVRSGFALDNAKRQRQSISSKSAKRFCWG